MCSLLSELRMTELSKRHDLFWLRLVMLRSAHTLFGPRLGIIPSDKALWRPSECFILSKHTLFRPRLVMPRSENTLSWPRLVMPRSVHTLFRPRLVIPRSEHTLFRPSLVMLRSEHTLSWLKNGMLLEKNDHSWPKMVIPIINTNYREFTMISVISANSRLQCRSLFARYFRPLSCHKCILVDLTGVHNHIHQWQGMLIHGLLHLLVLSHYEPCYFIFCQTPSIFFTCKSNPPISFLLRRMGRVTSRASSSTLFRPT